MRHFRRTPPATAGRLARCALTVVVLVVLTTPAAAQAPPGWVEPIEPFQIADQLYYVGTAGLSAFLVTSDDGHALIDVPLSANVDRVASGIRALGFDPADVVVQLASHAHFDHVGGIAEMQEITGAELILSTADAVLVGDGGASDPGGITGYQPATADRTLGHLDTVEVGPMTLTAHVTPGHTPGCTSWSGEVTIEGEPFTFVSVCSLTVLPGYRLLGDDATYEGIAEDFCRSAAHLASLDPDIFLAPHGSFFGMSEKLVALRGGDRRAFVERERYRRYLESASAAIDERLAREGHAGGCATLNDSPRAP